MDFTKILAGGLVVLLVTGGAAAGAGAGVEPPAATSDTNSVTNADADATYGNGTVTLRLVDGADGDGVANATVDVKREYQREYDDQDVEDEQEYDRVGTTDANGTITFPLAPANESRNVTSLEVELTTGAFNGELEYRVDNGSLSLIEEAYEYEQEKEHREGYNDTTQYNESGRMSAGMSDARGIADATLDEPSQGNWTLVEADAHEEDNYYKFEYVLVGADRPGEAEIRVHGSNGEVIEYEQDIEQDEQEEEVEDEDEQEEERGGD